MLDFELAEGSRLGDQDVVSAVKEDGVHKCHAHEQRDERCRGEFILPEEPFNPYPPAQEAYHDDKGAEHGYPPGCK